MAAYAIKGQQAAVAYQAPGLTVLRQRVNLPDLIANPGKLALAASPTLGLTSFAGFSATDTLKAILIPAGFFLLNLGIDVTVAEGAACTIDVGDSASATQWLNDLDINALGSTLAAATTLKGYNTANYVSVLFNSNATDVVVFDVLALGYLNPRT